MNRRDRISRCLRDALAPARLSVSDESHLHVGHAGARDGHGHFRVNIVAEAFAGKPRLARHRMVYAALGGMMQSDIHALSISALTPAEAGNESNASPETIRSDT